jgi:hypothetical protein
VAVSQPPFGDGKTVAETPQGRVDQLQADAGVVQVVRWQGAGAMPGWVPDERRQRGQCAAWAAVAPSSGLINTA